MQQVEQDYFIDSPKQRLMSDQILRHMVVRPNIWTCLMRHVFQTIFLILNDIFKYRQNKTERSRRYFFRVLVTKPGYSWYKLLATNLELLVTLCWWKNHHNLCNAQILCIICLYYQNDNNSLEMFVWYNPTTNIQWVSLNFVHSYSYDTDNFFKCHYINIQHGLLLLAKHICHQKKRITETKHRYELCLFMGDSITYFSKWSYLMMMVLSRMWISLSRIQSNFVLVHCVIP